MVVRSCVKNSAKKTTTPLARIEHGLPRIVAWDPSHHAIAPYTDLECEQNDQMLQKFKGFLFWSRVIFGGKTLQLKVILFFWFCPKVQKID
jgi:hypothetical protein